MIVDVDRYGAFTLDEDFVDPYRRRPVEWGFGALSWVAFHRSYSRDGEDWWQCCRRVIEGMFTVWQIHCLANRLRWNSTEAAALAREAYDRLWHFKWTPPGRGLWIMGTPFLYERGGAALNNCGFVSTRSISGDYAGPFLWMLQMSMLGVGVGFDTRGAGATSIVRPRISEDTHVIADSREGWAQALERLLRAYVGQGRLPRRWDTAGIRPRGAPLKGFGGAASGPEPLSDMLSSLNHLHDQYIGRRVDSAFIVDAMNLIGRCVVAGGVRRSAQIAFGEPQDRPFLDLKQDRRKVQAYRWVSNNSIFARVGMDYRQALRRTADNGEPGFFWLETARVYGRLVDPPDWADRAADGSNPCVEQTLHDRELCTLVETYPARHENLTDYLRTLRIAYLYAKIVTLVPTEDDRTNAVMQRNRRIGCSMTGVVQAIDRHGMGPFFEFCRQGYVFLRALDEETSHRLAVPRSIKLTSVKPSGTVSLLAGATPGVHWDHAPYYLRRVRLAAGHPVAAMCRQAGYPVEEDRYSGNTEVVSFPVHVPNLPRRKADVSVVEKVDLAAQMQRFWSDNQVSCTVEFDPRSESKRLLDVLKAYETRLKAIVFMPFHGHGYPQPPYEEIAREQYERMAGGIGPLRGFVEHESDLEERFCEGPACALESPHDDLTK